MLVTCNDWLQFPRLIIGPERFTSQVWEGPLRPAEVTQSHKDQNDLNSGQIIDVGVLSTTMSCWKHLIPSFGPSGLQWDDDFITVECDDVTEGKAN